MAWAGALIGEIGRKLSRLHPDCRLGSMTTDVVAMVFEAADLDEARARTARCVAALEAPLTLGDNTIDISLTAGVAVFTATTNWSARCSNGPTSRSTRPAPAASRSRCSTRRSTADPSSTL